MEKILSINKNQIAIIIEYYAIYRKLIHQWLNSEESVYFHRSFSSPHYNRDYKLINRFYKCVYCDKKIPILKENYGYGCMDNNKDEYYYIECKECDYSFCWECNYDSHDNIVTNCIPKNNMIVFGNYIKHCQKQNNISDNEYNKKELIDYLKRKKIHIIEAPNKILSKKQFIDYINKEISC